jgi:hypothetical protein
MHHLNPPPTIIIIIIIVIDININIYNIVIKIVKLLNFIEI